MDWTDPFWAQELADVDASGDMSEQTLLIQLTIPNLRANGQPSKRALLTCAPRLPGQVVCLARWRWNHSPVHFFARPLDPRTRFNCGAQSQFFAPAYLPFKLLRGRLVWGNCIWMSLDKPAIQKWLPPEAVLDEPDTWVPIFLETQGPTFE